MVTAGRHIAEVIAVIVGGRGEAIAPEVRGHVALVVVVAGPPGVVGHEGHRGHPLKKQTNL